jgi:tRNA dimethylallyltransferase
MPDPEPTTPWQRFPILVGPTAGGKSALAVATAHRLGEWYGLAAEIVTADSIQVFRGMDIGTAKPTVAEMDGFPHHLFDLIDPRDRFSVHQWLGLAERTIAEVRARGAVPIVVGGTHLYVKALVDGMFEGPEVDDGLRAELNGRDLAELRRELETVDPVAARRINAADKRRTVRALEVFRATGTPISVLQSQWDRDVQRRKDCAIVGLEWPIDAVNRRINARVKQMIDRGLIDEARSLWERGMLGVQAREALGYKQLIPYFEGGCSAEDAIERIKIETRRFGKNQRTWLKRLKMVPGSVWIDTQAVPAAEWPGLVLKACGIG